LAGAVFIVVAKLKDDAEPRPSLLRDAIQMFVAAVGDRALAAPNTNVARSLASV
jgi:hypothetical protein